MAETREMTVLVQHHGFNVDVLTVGEPSERRERSAGQRDVGLESRACKRIEHRHGEPNNCVRQREPADVVVAIERRTTGAGEDQGRTPSRRAIECEAEGRTGDGAPSLLRPLHGRQCRTAGRVAVRVVRLGDEIVVPIVVEELGPDVSRSEEQVGWRRADVRRAEQFSCGGGGIRARSGEDLDLSWMSGDAGEEDQ